MSESRQKTRNLYHGSSQMFNEYFSSGDGANDYAMASATMPPTAVPSMLSSELKEAKQMAFNVDILLVAVGVVFMCLIRVWLQWLVRDSPDEDMQAQPSDGDGENDIQKLLVEDWVSLYDKTFRSNPNRTVLGSGHITRPKSEGNCDGEDVNDEEQPSSIHASMRDHSNKNGGDGFCDPESGQDSNKIKQDDYLTSSYNMILDALVGRNRTKNVPPLVSGTCVICFEEFQAGDEVVWSSSSATDYSSTTQDEEDETNHDGRCQHVYHQECMVQYLANHSHRRFRKLNYHRQGSSLDIETPCPTCRRNFCTISKEDLSTAIQTRCIAIEETGSSSSGSSDEDDQDESQEGLSQAASELEQTQTPSEEHV